MCLQSSLDMTSPLNRGGSRLANLARCRVPCLARLLHVWAMEAGMRPCKGWADADAMKMARDCEGKVEGSEREDGRGKGEPQWSLQCRYCNSTLLLLLPCSSGGDSVDC